MTPALKALCESLDYIRMHYDHACHMDREAQFTTRDSQVYLDQATVHKILAAITDLTSGQWRVVPVDFIDKLYDECIQACKNHDEEVGRDSRAWDKSYAAINIMNDIQTLKRWSSLKLASISDESAMLSAAKDSSNG